jgi:hypothetical protein
MTASVPLEVKLGSLRTCNRSYVAKIYGFYPPLKPIVLELEKF